MHQCMLPPFPQGWGRRCLGAVGPGGGRPLCRARAQLGAGGQHRQQLPFTCRLPGALPSRENLAKEVRWPSLPPQACPCAGAGGGELRCSGSQSCGFSLHGPSAFASLGRFAEGAERLLHCRFQGLLRKKMSENNG